jgi:ABC-type phosphate transport system substrate-binding protein
MTRRSTGTPADWRSKAVLVCAATVGHNGIPLLAHTATGPAAAAARAGTPAAPGQHATGVSMDHHGTRSALRMTTSWLRVRRWAAMLAVAVIALGIGAVPASAAGHAAISGSGSTWASLPVDQWSQDVRPAGLVVNYNPDGSVAGRADFIAGQDDFAFSDVPFRDGRDKLGHTKREVVPWGYSYIPLPAGGIAFPYHIEDQGRLIINLRLTPKLLLGIFTGKITNWDDPAIRKVYRAPLPNLPITPVIRSDGSAPTYYFTRWMAHVFPRQWNAFCDQIDPHIKPPCGQTEFYPQFGHAQAENGANNVMAYITSTYGNGAIGYDEYAYVLQSHYPVLQLRNPAGKYLGPTPTNVTTALTQATVDTNPRSPSYLQVNLNRLYTDTNPANYPLSYTGYLIAPRTGRPKPPPPHFTDAKGRTLSAFTVFALCHGQSHLAATGFAPLPPNLIKDGLQQARHIPGHGPIPRPSHCPAIHPSHR